MSELREKIGKEWRHYTELLNQGYGRNQHKKVGVGDWKKY